MGDIPRRKILRRGLATGAMVVGFDSTGRAWAATPADGPASGGSLTGLPQLDGVLLTDPADLAAAADDYGHIIHHTPLAVLQPGSVDDIVKMVRFCNEHGLAVAPRGQGHQTFGQAQVAGGLVVDTGPLDSVSVQGQTVVVGAGARWSTVVQATLADGLTPPVFTDYLELSVGGTLSVGGVGGASHHYGAQADNVLALQVVTGAGDLVTCSPDEKADLFHATLAGLGQCAIIVSATLPLLPAPTSVRQYSLSYPTFAALAADQRKVVQDGRFNWLEGAVNPATSGSGWVYVLEGAAYYDTTSPDDAALLGDLSYEPGSAQISDSSYYAFLDDLAPAVAYLESTGEWYDPHPWWNVFLPDQVADSYVTTVQNSLTSTDIGASGVLLLYPVPQDKFGEPLLRLPAGELTFLYAILRTAAPDDAEPADEMLVSNKALYEAARALGGYQYPVGSIPMTQADWIAHYGPAWPAFQAARHRYDPSGLLTPGQGIFT